MTDTIIANIALAQVGAERIGSLDDTTKGARRCKDILPTIKQRVLEACEWGFATKYVQVTRKLETPLNATAAYQRVNGDIRAIGVLNEQGVYYGRFNNRRMNQWRIQGRDIVTTSPTAPDSVLIKYVDSETPEGMYPASVQLAIATELAAHLSLALTKSKTLYTYKMDEAKMLLEEAMGNDAVQGSDEDLEPLKLQQTRTRMASRRGSY